MSIVLNWPIFIMNVFLSHVRNLSVLKVFLIIFRSIFFFLTFHVCNYNSLNVKRVSETNFGKCLQGIQISYWKRWLSRFPVGCFLFCAPSPLVHVAITGQPHSVAIPAALWLVQNLVEQVLLLCFSRLSVYLVRSGLYNQMPHAGEL